MIPLTFNSEPVFLLPYRPDGTTAAQATFEMLTTGSRSQSGRGGRGALRYTLATSYQFTLQLFSVEVAAFNRALKQLEDKRVLCPFWPAAQLFSTAAAPWASTGIWLTIERDGQSEVHTTSSPGGFTPSASAIKVPLMLGIFEKDPKPVLAKPTASSCEIRFVEDGPADYALRPKSTTAADGPALSGRAPKVFPLVADWSSPPAYGEATVEIDRRTEGFTRERAISYQPQTPERILELGVSTLTADESAALLAFFHARQGDVEGFWIEGAGEDTTLTADTSAGSAVINVNATADLGDTRFLAFVRSRQASILREVISIDAGAGTLTLNSSPGTLAKGSVRLVALVLARFASAKLTFNFVAGGKARVAVTAREIGTEYTTPADETYGVTIGALPRIAQVYRFKLKYPADDVVTRYTSYEKTVTAAGEVFTSLKGLSHGNIVDSLDIEKTTVKLSARIPEGSVLEKLSPFTLEVPLEVEILECVPDASGTSGAPEMRFVGKVVKPKRRGVWLDFEAVHLLEELQEDVPTMIIQGADNNEMFSPESGVDAEDWTFTASVVSVSASGSSITLNTLARTLGVPEIGADYFRTGKVSKGSGAAYQARTIVKSTALSSGQVTLYLNNSFDGSVSGSVSLLPGYSGDPEEARTKFGAYARVAAFPFVPIGNPELLAVTQEQKTGKK